MFDMLKALQMRLDGAEEEGPGAGRSSWKEGRGES